MVPREITADDMMSFEVASDGECVRLRLRDGEQPVTLIMPTSFMNSLLVNLPRMLHEAVRRQDSSGDTRVVQALEGFKLESGQLEECADQFVLTLFMNGGAPMSFTTSADNFAAMGTTILEATLEHTFPDRVASCSS